VLIDNIVDISTIAADAAPSTITREGTMSIAPPAPPPDPQAMFAVSRLIVVARRLADDLESAARQLHAGEALTVAERGLLLLLRQGAAQTIPQLAARREASRQYIQHTLAPLAARGLVAWRDNPHHRRSKLAELTPEGIEMARRVMAREGALLGALSGVDDPARLLAATEVLRRLDAALRAEPAAPPLRRAQAKG
jgi:DNA-binding MarR family transcriptional regulator